MRNADDRSGLVLSRLLFCFIGIAIAAVGVGLAINSIGVTESPSDQRESESTPTDHAPKPTDLVSLPISTEQVAASNANGHFAVDLYQRLANTEAENNIFL